MKHRTFCLTDRRIPYTASAALRERGFTVCPLSPLGTLPAPVASHTDLLVFPLGDTVVTRRRTARENAGIFAALTDAGYTVLPADDGDVGGCYPADVGLCAFASGDALVCRPASADPVLLGLAAARGLRLLPVRQGYAKCACVPLPDGSVVTSDAGIAAALRRAGHEVLTVSPGGIDLPGYDTGLIGGCCGLFTAPDGRAELFFVGDPDRHPDGGAIRKFCAARGVDVTALTDGRLFDVGSLFFLNSRADFPSCSYNIHNTGL